jgi:uncharacterized OB-fold protein
MGLSRALDMPGSAQRPRLDREAGVLVGSRCEHCGATSWPARAICHHCGVPTTGLERFAPRGSLLTHTEVWTARPGLEVPYRLAQVQLDDGPAIFCHVRALAPGRPVPLPVRLVVAADDAAVPPFWFEPEEER